MLMGTWVLRQEARFRLGSSSDVVLEDVLPSHGFHMGESDQNIPWLKGFRASCGWSLLLWCLWGKEQMPVGAFVSSSYGTGPVEGLVRGGDQWDQIDYVTF